VFYPIKPSLTNLSICRFRYILIFYIVMYHKPFYRYRKSARFILAEVYITHKTMSKYLVENQNVNENEISSTK